MSKLMIIQGMNCEDQMKDAYEQLKEDGKVDLSWDQYCEEVAEIVEQNNGDVNDAVDMLDDFLTQQGIDTTFPIFFGDGPTQ